MLGFCVLTVYECGLVADGMFACPRKCAFRSLHARIRAASSRNSGENVLYFPAT
jgi:hypothetical protein